MVVQRYGLMNLIPIDHECENLTLLNSLLVSPLPSSCEPRIDLSLFIPGPFLTLKNLLLGSSRKPRQDTEQIGRHSSKQSSGAGKASHRDEAGSIVRRARARPEAAAVDGREVADAVGNGDDDGALLGGQAHESRGPGEDQGQGKVQAGDVEAQEHVARGVVADLEQHEGADKGHGQPARDVPAPVAGAVGDLRHDDEEGGGDAPDGYGHPLHHGARVAHALEHRRDEIGNGRRAIVQHVQDDKDVGAKVEHGGAHRLPGAQLGRGHGRRGVSVVHQPDHGQGALLWRQPGRVLWIVEQHELGDYAKEDGSNSFNQKQPPPALHAPNALESGNDCARHQAAGCTGKAESREEDGESFACKKSTRMSAKEDEY